MTDATLEPIAATAGVESPFRRFVADFAASRLAMIGLVLLVIVVLGALLAPWVAPQNPYDIGKLDIMDTKLKPGTASADYRVIYWLGTDGQARDMLSAILYGLRSSLFIGVVSIAIALAIGTALGLAAAYFGGRTDAVIMRIVDIQLSFPAILVALVLLAVMGKGIDKVLIALVAVQWAYFARAARAAALVERGKEYIEAAQCLALGRARIVLRHLLPNCLPPLIVIATIEIAHAIALEATLSFLGVGVPVTEPSLGMLIANGFDYVLSGKYWISVFPGLALALAIVAINLVGDHLREILNPRNLR